MGGGLGSRIRGVSPASLARTKLFPTCGGGVDAFAGLGGTVATVAAAAKVAAVLELCSSAVLGLSRGGAVTMGAGTPCGADRAAGRLMAVEPNREGPRVRKGDRVSLLFRAEDCAVLPPGEG